LAEQGNWLSKDAYRAIQDVFDEKRQVKRILVAQLQEGIQLLDQRMIDEFVRLFFESKLSEQEAAEFASQRAVVIDELKTAVSALQSPPRAAIVTEAEALDSYRIQAVTPAIVDITFRKTGDRWKIVK